MIKLHSCYAKDFHGKWEMGKSATQFHILLVVTKGKIIYYVNEESVLLQKGDVLFMPAGTVRGGISSEEHQRYATHFTLDDNDRMLLPLLAENRYCKTTISGFEYFKQRFMLLKHHWLMRGPYSEPTCYAILLELLSIINYERDNWKLPAKKIEMTEDIKTYLLDHYKDSVSLDDLAELTGRTPNHVSHLFKSVTGLSPIDYLHHVRIVKAKELMIDKMMSISEIAEETGFCDQAYFNRVFKKVTGCSPTAFMKGRTG
ncbi:helix-turn-helix domain-containing protein [Paenibacillus sp. BC26]|uniref:helix-turn-helix domain-containing protein n=1 Tax=Paenibacillus sp. BC26 TaxID=1881032 RepID=UPI0008E5C094|nr:helix-turn-helix domain-containing protein [Paenibacillus sp. BC26]SFT07327.1 AraC family transcriptional regulator, arabinose operon regulatory protein [Paenibacillus sp. BC26]